ncbi:hypothetical protein GCM10007304_35510 [Rhodococcoides trifolii]|uniref:RDD domain-containing protein n=1 Tax=Rhodococcoides trifolii TaxID=908250 RepID=A0A917G1P0_9NOCA|nr:RDD family protein [Rhodococcus trifolii]GGG18447.1 hypothetical protein GCM10007304_35510 [Rhodococcus trifolii]
MTSGGYDPNQDPQGNPPQGGQGGTPPPGSYPSPGQYPPPGAYPPPGQYPPPQQGGQQYGQPGGYPPPPQSGYPGQPQQGGYSSQPQYDPGQQYGGFPNPSGSGAPGDLWIRLGARIIDGIIVGIVSLILALIFASTGNFIVTGLLTAIIGFGYFVAMETTQGGTLGKKVLGLSVHGPGGAAKPTPQQSAIRNVFLLFGIIPFVGSLLVLVAYIVIAVTINNSPTKQGKHDEIAGGTQVVKN